MEFVIKMCRKPAKYTECPSLGKLWSSAKIILYIFVYGPSIDVAVSNLFLDQQTSVLLKGHVLLSFTFPRVA